MTTEVIYFAVGVLLGGISAHLLGRTALELYRTQLNEASAQLSRYVAAASRNPHASQVLTQPAEWSTMGSPDFADAHRWLFDETGLMAVPDDMDTD